MLEFPEYLQKAIATGTLTREDVREIFALEAEALGIPFEEAVRRARERSLAKSCIGADLELLVDLLAPV